ncbi:MAG: hypothetical protein ABIR96_04665 [Bdellovibrionota bacterium]
MSGCSLTGPVRDDPKATGFTFKAPDSSRWDVLKERADADDAWVHKKTGATLALRSLCGRYEHLSIQALSDNLMNIVGDAEIQTRDPMTLAGRAALSTIFEGNIDGVEIQNRLVVVRKDNCIFDFTLSQLAKISPDVMKDFDAFLPTFSYSGGEAK